MNIGIYGYTEKFSDTFGGVESSIQHFARKLSKIKNNKVIIHALSTKKAGFNVEGDTFSINEQSSHITKNLIEYTSSQGPDIDGVINENTNFSKQQKEEVILAFGTRDGYVFDIAIKASKTLKIKLISFVFFTNEERWVRNQFTSFTRSIPGINSKKEQITKNLEDIETLKNVILDSDKVIVPTYYVKGQISSYLTPLEMTKVKVVYHGVDTTLFKQLKLKRTNNILHVSRLSIPFALHKNFLWSCEFVNQLPKPYNKVIFLGEGNGSDIISTFIEKNNLQDRIEIAGHLSQKKLNNVYNTSKILLTPSMMEAGCTILVEAVLSGCLPIALNFAGISEIMEFLGLQKYLIDPIPFKFNSNVNTVVPSKKHTIEILNYVSNNPKSVSNDLAEAQKIAKKYYSLNYTTNKIIQILNDKR